MQPTPPPAPVPAAPLAPSKPVGNQSAFLVQDVDLESLKPLSLAGHVCMLAGAESAAAASATVPPFCQPLDCVQWNADLVFETLIPAKDVPFDQRAPVPEEHCGHAVSAMLQVPLAWLPHALTMRDHTLEWLRHNGSCAVLKAAYGIVMVKGIARRGREMLRITCSS